MKAITLPEFGGPDALVLADVDTPSPRAGEVLVRVAAAGVNRADLLQRQGHYAPPAGESDVPGLEVSGDVEALGEGVDDWSVGDEVCAPARRRRVRRAGAGAGRAAAAGARRGLPGGRGGAAGGRVHGVVQRLPHRQPPARRDAARARRVVRHRHDGDPAGTAGRGTRHRHGGVGGQARGVPRARAPRCWSTTGRRTSSSGVARGHGRPRRGRHPRHRRREVLVPQRFCARHERPARHHRHAGRHAWRARHRGADGEARRPSSRRRCGRGPRPRRPPSWRRCASTSGRSSRPGGCEPIVHSRHPLADAAAAHRELEASEHIGKILLTTG